MTAMGNTDRSVTELIETGRDREAARLGASHHVRRQPMDPLTELDQLGPLLVGVVGAITPDQLDLRTPCADFTVRGVLEHMIGGETPAEPDLTDVLAAFGPALGDLAAAITAPGALDRTVTTPFGDLPGETFARYVVLDGLVHGWDLASATGLPYDPPDALVAEVDAYAQETLEPLRDGQTFGPAVEPSPDATPMERLAAHTGRRPIAAGR
jgi:uncharacterized protein (TIGR03086 family)